MRGVAYRFDEAYWDGPRHVGYGSYRYDGRWRVIAETWSSTTT